MDQKFTTRGYIVFLPVSPGENQAKFVVADWEPDGQIIGRRCYVGPAPLSSRGPMPDHELMAWERHLVTKEGYASHPMPNPYRRKPATTEADVKADQEAAGKAKVFVTLAGDEGDLIVTVKNLGENPLPHLEVAWVCEYETPQPETIGRLEVEQLGQDLTLAPDNSLEGSLEPNRVCRFLLGSSFIATMKSQVAALSSDRYHLSVRCGKSEFYRIEGGEIGAFIDLMVSPDAEPGEDAVAA